MNIDNFNLVYTRILMNPSEWDQNVWHCKTKHCFAGLAQLISGRLEDSWSVREDARRFLDITDSEAIVLFCQSRTLDDFKLVSDRKSLYSSEGYDLAGYDREGYGREGYDREGYGRDGYDRNGYDICDRDFKDALRQRLP